ncbi:MAG: hypothetical protein JXA78_17415 [Anaerolineales bacterium]|nr:hypothetical protein [Anaerolineales bacterium]
MEELWFEEELLPEEDALQQTAKELATHTESDQAEIEHEIRQQARGILRADRPRWDELKAENAPLRSGESVRFYMVRLGFQFYIPKPAYDLGARFVFARCEARLWASQPGQPDPLLYEVIPKDLYDGEPRKVAIKLGPEIKIGDYGGSLGEISSDLYTGHVTPAIVGWPGEDERAPFWELRPVTKEISGVQHLWLVIEKPEACEAFRLAVWAQADVRTKFGPIVVGPKENIWAHRPSVLIPR